jgi:hypothetical protein
VILQGEGSIARVIDATREAVFDAFTDSMAKGRSTAKTTWAGSSRGLDRPEGWIVRGLDRPVEELSDPVRDDPRPLGLDEVTRVDFLESPIGSVSTYRRWCSAVSC